MWEIGKKLWIKFVKILNSFAFVSAVLSFVLTIVGEKQPESFIFLWVIAFAAAACYFKLKSNKIYRLFLIIIFAPVFFGLGDNSVMYIVINGVFSVYFIEKGLYTTGYEDFADEFKIIIKFVFLILFASLIFRGPFKIQENTMAYIIIYVITSVLLLRMLRIDKYESNHKNEERLNAVYAVSLSGAAFALSVRTVREFIFYYLNSALTFVLDLIGKAVMYVLIPIGYFTSYLSQLFKGLHLKGNVQMNTTQTSDNNVLKDQDPKWAKAVIESKNFEFILKIIFVVIVVFVLFLIFRRAHKSSQKEEAFEEERESIIFENKKQKKSKSLFDSFFKPQGVENAIRWYYVKFLKLCRKSGINYSKSDTSLDINKEACSVYDKTVLEKFRDIYIRARYGTAPCASKDESEASSLFKKMKK